MSTEVRGRAYPSTEFSLWMRNMASILGMCADIGAVFASGRTMWGGCGDRGRVMEMVGGDETRIWGAGLGNVVALNWTREKKQG